MTRERILREAAGLFALKGFHDTKLEEVLKAARVTSGAFFHHFQNKDDLGHSVIKHHMERRKQRLDAIEAGLPAAAGKGPLERVFRRLDAVREMVASRWPGEGGCIIGNLSTALADTHPKFRMQLAACFDQMAQEFEQHLEPLVQRREPGTLIDPGELARYIVTVIEGAIMLSRTYHDQHLLERQFDYLKTHLRQVVGRGAHKAMPGRPKTSRQPVNTERN